MSRTAIRVEDLAKRYRIGERQEPYKTLRDALASAAAQPFRRLASALRGESARASRSSIWALKDISLEFREGEVVGVIGRNGAGKTTLLKVLSRITEPTRGRAEIHGRVGSLLEVGTGFHPELTGRENVFLNGAILGMKRAEIHEKFDAIVQFAGVESFIDTPIKHYSSGMGLRLGFAVAAHLEPDILLVDEVLAVGDLAFQQKCLGKIDELTHEGRTVLFVSHNLYAIHAICEKVVWLDEGEVRDSGPTDVIVPRYQLAMSREGTDHRELQDRDTPEARITRISVNGDESRYVHLSGRVDLDVEWDFEVRRPLELSFGCSLSKAEGVQISGLASHLEGQTFQVEPGTYTAGVRFSHLDLHSGAYVLRLSLMSPDGSHSYSYRSPAATLYVEAPFRFDGIVALEHAWCAPEPAESSESLAGTGR